MLILSGKVQFRPTAGILEGQTLGRPAGSDCLDRLFWGGHLRADLRGLTGSLVQRRLDHGQKHKKNHAKTIPHENHMEGSVLPSL